MILAELKEKSRALATKYDTRYGERMVDEYIQLSVGIWVLQAEAGASFDLTETIRTSALLAAHNADNDSAKMLQAKLLGDEELSQDILQLAGEFGLEVSHG